MEFHTRQKVEVIGKEDGLKGSLYVAKVISNEGSEQYKVEYETLLKKDKFGPLQEVVHSDHLHPELPHVPNDFFSLEEFVDAYHNDGWWVGLIEGRFAFHYFVYFPTTEKEVSFPLDKLRVHLDWSKGKWKPCAAYKKRIKNTFKTPLWRGNVSNGSTSGQ